MLSVFTPSHDPQYLDECWDSLRAQTHQDFEWIVVLDHHAKWQKPSDDRVRVTRRVPAVTARFVMSRLFTFMPTQWHAENNVPYVCCNLVKAPC